MDLKNFKIGQSVTSAAVDKTAARRLFSINLRKAIDTQKKFLDDLLGRSAYLNYDGFTKDGSDYHLGFTTTKYSTDNVPKPGTKVKGWKWEKDDGEDWLNHVTKSGSTEVGSVHVEYSGREVFVYVRFDFEQARKLFDEPKLSPISVNKELRRWYRTSSNDLDFSVAKKIIEQREAKKQQKSLDALVKDLKLKNVTFTKAGNSMELHLEVPESLKELQEDIDKVSVHMNFFDEDYEFKKLDDSLIVQLTDRDFKNLMTLDTSLVTIRVHFAEGKAGLAAFKIAIPDNPIKREADKQRQEHEQKERERRSRENDWFKNHFNGRRQAAPKEDPYKVLEIPEDSDFTTIKKAYRTQMMKHHPDRGGSEDMAKKINDAYEYLQKMKWNQATSASEILASMGLRDLFKESSMNLKDMKVGQVIATTVETAATSFKEYKKLHPNTKKTYNDPMFSKDPSVQEYTKHNDAHHESFKKIMNEKDKHGSMDHFYTNDPIKYRELHDEKDGHHQAREKAYKKMTGQK